MKQQTQINQIEWKDIKLGEILDYEQPGDYIVNSEILKIKDKDKVPVLTANKAFILGYTSEKRGVYNKLPVIIFDDFTTDSKFVDFKFKVKSSAMKMLRPKSNNISLKFIFYMMRGVKVNFSTHKRYYLSVYRNKKVLMPFKDGELDLTEQERIVSILEYAKKQVESGKKAEELLDEYLKSVFSEMFREYLKDKQNYKKIIDFVSEDKNAIKAGPFGSSLKKECYVTKGYKIYGQEQVIKDDLNFGDYYISKDKYNELKSYEIQEGDVLISLVGTYGKISVVPRDFEPGIINPRLMKITLDKKKMNPIFFKFLFNSKAVKKELENSSHGGTMDIVNVGIIKRIGFPLPPLPLQQKFAEIVGQVEKMKEDVKKTKQNSEELFNSLMSKAFKGKL